MTIPKDQLEKWKKLRSRGDGVKIQEEHPLLNSVAIYRAFKTGSCPDYVFECLAAYYKKKSERVQEMAI